RRVSGPSPGCFGCYLQGIYSHHPSFPAGILGFRRCLPHIQPENSEITARTRQPSKKSNNTTACCVNAPKKSKYQIDTASVNLQQLWAVRKLRVAPVIIRRPGQCGRALAPSVSCSRVMKSCEIVESDSREG